MAGKKKPSSSPSKTPPSQLTPEEQTELQERLLQLEQTRIEADRALCLGPYGFGHFVRMGWSIAEPRRKLRGLRPNAETSRPPWLPRHLHAIAIHLEAWARAIIELLLINIPPGMGKSLLLCVLYGAWRMACDPTWRGMFGSYGEKLSNRDSKRMRRLVNSEWYQSRFVRGWAWVDGQWQRASDPSAPAWAMSSDEDTVDLWSNTLTGGRKVASVTGEGTGYRADEIGVDDPLKAKEAHSEAARDEAWEWITDTLWTRFEPDQVVKICIIMQRLHDDDPSGRALAQGEDWVHLRLPTFFEPARRCQTAVIDPETGQPWEDWRQEADELLCPEIQSLKKLEKDRRVMGAGFAGQHQQDPVNPKDSLFKRENWRFYRKAGHPDESGKRPRGCWTGTPMDLPDIELMIVSVDCTFKANPNSDRVAVHVWGRRGPDKFLLDRRTRRLTFIETCAELKAVCTAWPRYHLALVETKANGDAVVNVMSAVLPRLNPEEVKKIANPTDSKVARANAVSPEVGSGNVYLPDGAPWLEEFISEHERFPKATHDDDVDALTQALNYLGFGGDDLEEMRRYLRAGWN